MSNISRFKILVCLLAGLFVLCVGGGSPAAAGMSEGWAAYNKGDYVAAFIEFKAAADQGDKVAQNSLGYMYQNGQGVEKSPDKALEWYKKAAEQGYAPAQTRLAAMYEQGQGTAPDPVEAKKWYTMAADQGDKKAKEGLGRILAAEKAAPKPKPAPAPKQEAPPLTPPEAKKEPAPPTTQAPQPGPEPKPAPGPQADTAPQQVPPSPAEPKTTGDPGSIFKEFMAGLEKNAKVDIGLISISPTGFRVYDLVVEPKEEDTKKVSAELIEITEIGIRPTDAERFLFSGSVKNLEVENADGTKVKIAHLALDRLDVDTKNQNFSLDKAIVQGIEALNPMGAATVSSVEIEGCRFEGEKSFALKKFEIKDVASNEGLIGGSSLKRFVVEDVNLPDFDVPKDWEVGLFSLEDLKVNQGGAPIASLVKLSSTNKKNGTRIDSQLVLDQLIVTDKVPYQPFADLMSQVQRTSLTLNAEIKGYYDSSDGTVDLTAINFSMPELGRLDVALKMSGINPVTEMDDKAMGDFMSKAAFHALKISYKDAGLAQILIGLAAAEAKQEPAQYVQGLKEMLKQQAEGMGPVFVPMAEQMIKFLDNPVAIHLSAVPDQPVLAGTLGELTEDEMVKTLKVQVKAD